MLTVSSTTSSSPPCIFMYQYMTSCTVMYSDLVHDKYMTPQKSCTNIVVSCTDRVPSCILHVFNMYFACTCLCPHVLVHEVMYWYITSCTGSTWVHVLVHNIMYWYIRACFSTRMVHDFHVPVHEVMYQYMSRCTGTWHHVPCMYRTNSSTRSTWQVHKLKYTQHTSNTRKVHVQYMKEWPLPLLQHT